MVENANQVRNNSSLFTNKAFDLFILILLAFIYYIYSHRHTWWKRKKERMSHRMQFIANPFTIFFFSLLIMELFVAWDLLSKTWITAMEGEMSVFQTMLEKAGAEGTSKMRKTRRIIAHLSSSGMVAGGLAFVVCFGHLYHVARDGYDRRKALDMANLWQTSDIEDNVLSIIAMPVIIIIMAGQSSIRAWLLISEFDTGADRTYSQIMFNLNFEVAIMWQYVAIFLFTRLMKRILGRHLPVPMRIALGQTSFIGIWAFVITGLIRNFAAIGEGCLLLKYLGEDTTGFKSLKVIASVVDNIKMVFLVLMIICIYSMVVFAKLEPVKECLGRASLKFLSLRAMVLLMRYQPALCNMLSDPDKELAKLKVDSHINESAFRSWLTSFGVTQDYAHLLHSALICWECLFAVVFNYWAWRHDANEARLYFDEFGEELERYDKEYAGHTYFHLEETNTYDNNQGKTSRGIRVRPLQSSNATSNMNTYHPGMRLLST